MDDLCPLCPDAPGVYIGSMGRLVHLRCRKCGWTWATPMPQPQVTEFGTTIPMETTESLSLGALAR